MRATWHGKKAGKFDVFLRELGLLERPKAARGQVHEEAQAVMARLQYATAVVDGTLPKHA